MKPFKIIMLLFAALANTVRAQIDGAKFAYEHYSRLARKKSIEEGNLDEAEKRATSLQHFTDSDFEELEREAANKAEYWDANLQNDWDDLEESFNEYLDEEGLDSDNIESITRARKRKIARKMYSRHGKRGGVFASRRFMGARNFVGKTFKGVKGQLTINVVRNTYNIPFDLPLLVFNSLDALCNSPIVTKFIKNPDLQFLGGYVDATLTNFVYRYRQISTGNLDSVTVSCNEIPYVKLIVGLQVDLLEVGGGTIKISDETKTVQFDKPFAFADQNILGRSTDNPLNMGSFIKPQNFRKDIADILIAFPVDKENGFIFTSAYLPGVPGGYQLTTTFFLNFSVVSMHKARSPRPLTI